MKYCEGANSCLVIMPLHPVFAPDATRLYSFWHFYYAGKFSSVKNDAKRRGIAQQIIKRAPVVISSNYHNMDFMLELYQRKLISSADYKKLILFLKENYTQKEIGEESYYIRNDRI
jgi:hypothetical protein